MDYFLIFAIIALNVSANFFMKCMANLPGQFVYKLFTWYGVGAVACFGGAFVIYILALQRVPLHIAQSFLAMQYGLVMLMAYFYFNEQITNMQWVGFGLMVIGLFFISFFKG